MQNVECIMQNNFNAELRLIHNVECRIKEFVATYSAFLILNSALNRVSCFNDRI